MSDAKIDQLADMIRAAQGQYLHAKNVSPPAAMHEVLAVAMQASTAGGRYFALTEVWLLLTGEDWPEPILDS